MVFGRARSTLALLSLLTAVSACTQSSTPPSLNQGTTLKLVSLTPASQYVNPAPTTVSASFSAEIETPSSAIFSVGGSCTTLPTVSQTLTLSPDKTAVTASLMGGNCENNQTLTVSVDPTQVTAVSGGAGTGSVVTNRYTVTTAGPSAALGAPTSTLLSSSGSSTIALTYTASTSGGSTLTGTLTPTGGGVTVTTVSGNPACSISVGGISPSGASLQLSRCTGNGTLTVHVDADTEKDAVGNPSTVSPESSVITVDTTGPAISSVIPASAVVPTAPNSIIVTFSESVQPLAASELTIGGNCTTAPHVSSVSMSSHNTVATATLSGGSCGNGHSLSVSVNPALVKDLAGNSGVGSAVRRQYDIDTSGPTAVFPNNGLPAVSYVNASTYTWVAFNYESSAAGGTALTGTLTASGGGITVTKVTGNPSCKVSVSSISTAGATILLSQCQGNGSLTVHVNAGTAKDAFGNFSSVSAESMVITVDNTPPTLVSPASGDSFIQTYVGLTFSEPIANLDASDFSISSSTCGTPPKVSNVSGVVAAETAVYLTGGNCAAGQTITLVIQMSSISDQAGNDGVGTVSVTLKALSTKKIFVTSSSAIAGGNLGGVRGADSLCAADPSNPHDGSTYKAMLSDGSTRIACTTPNCSGGASENVGWVLSANTAYITRDGLPIGITNSAGVFRFPLSNPVMQYTASSNWVVTGLGGDWTSGTDAYNCSKWTSDSGSAYVGYSCDTDATLINSGATTSVPIDSVRCTTGYNFSLYCVQQ